jgi:hypothetical protein
MKRYLSFILLLALMLSAIGVGHAVTVTIGDGTASASDPFHAYWGFGRSLSLFTADQIGQTGQITSLGWSVASTSATVIPYRIFIATTTATELTQMLWDSTDPADDTFVGMASLVKVGSYAFSTTGWHTFVLDTPFTYTGGNLLVGVESNYGGYGAGTYPNFHYTDSDPNTHQIWRADNNPPAGLGSVDPWRPNIQLEIGDIPTNPVFVLSPTEWDFGRVIINDTVSKTFTIRNNGVGTLNVTGLSPTSDGFFTVLNAPAWPVALTAGQSTTFDIQYAPTAVGPHTATFTITDGRANTNLTVNGECYDPTVYAYPFTEGFEVGQTDATPVGGDWTQILGGYTQYWMANSSQAGYNRTPRNGAFNATLRYYGDAWLMRPFSMQGGVSYDVEIWARQDASSGATLSLHYGTEGTIAGMTNAIGTPHNVVNGDYQRVYGNFTPPADGVYWIGIHGMTDIDPWYISIDDFTVQHTPTVPVLSLAPAEYDFGRVSINGTASQTFTITNTGVGTLNLTGISPTTDGFFSVTDAPGFPLGLGANESATFNIQYAPTAAGPHAASFTVNHADGSGTVTVNGECFDPTVYTYPFTEGFEEEQTDGQPVQEWTQHLGGSYNQYWMANSSQTTYNRIPRNGAFNATLRYGGDAWLMRPFSMQAGQGYDVEIWARQDGTSGATLSLHYGTEGTIAGMTNTIAGPASIINGDYQVVRGRFSPAADGIYWIGIHGTADYWDTWYLSIDDFSVQHEPTATLPPILVSPADGAVNVSKYGVDLTWEFDLEGATPNYYAVYLATDSATIYDEYRWETTNTSFNPVLEDNTFSFAYEQRYYWTVGAIFGTDEVVQETSRFFDIEADPTVSTYPWSENFDALNDYETPLGWIFLYSNDGDDRRGWYVLDHYQLEPHSEPNAAYVFYHQNYPKDEWMITNPFSMQEGQAYNISFAVQGEGWDGVPESLKVYWGTEPTVASLTSNPAIFDNNGAAYAEWTMVNAIFIPPATGIYYFGWHACTQADVDYIAVDTITISEAAAVDLAAMALGGDTYGYVNSPVEKTVSVSNMGSTGQSNYTVYLKEAVTNNVLAQELIAETLNPGETAVHTLSWTPAAAGVIDVYGEVELAGDANPANNVTDAVRVTIFSENVELLSIGATTGLAGINVAPFDAYYEGFVAETIYLASEIQVTSGEIEAVNYINYFVGGAWDFPAVQIWMQNTDVANVNDAWLPFENYVLVYEGPLHCPSGINDILISLDTPFNYTGGNLAIRTSKTYQADWGGDRYWIATLDENYPGRTRYYRSTTEGAVVPEAPTGGTPYDYIPNIVLAMNTTALVETLPAPAVNAAETTTGFELNWELIPYAYNYNVYVSADPYDYAAADTIVVYTNTYEMDTIADKSFYKVTAETYRDFTRAQVVLRNLEPRDIRIANEGMIAKPEKKAQRMTINK